MAINNLMDTNRVIFTLFIFGVYLKINTQDASSLSIIEHSKKEIQKAMDEI